MTPMDQQRRRVASLFEVRVLPPHRELPFRANVDVGLSVGLAGIGVAAAYVWSVRTARLASRPPRQLPV
jgi:hypothetical protein